MMRWCRYRVRLRGGWSKVPCGAEAVEGAEHCARHHRPCHDREPHERHTWTPEPPAHQQWDKPGSLTCTGVQGPALPPVMRCVPSYAWPGDHEPHSVMCLPPPGGTLSEDSGLRCLVDDKGVGWAWCRGRGSLSTIGVLMGMEAGDLVIGDDGEPVRSIS